MTQEIVPDLFVMVPFKIHVLKSVMKNKAILVFKNKS